MTAFEASTADRIRLGFAVPATSRRYVGSSFAWWKAPAPNSCCTVLAVPRAEVTLATAVAPVYEWG